jgi:hypothetical protein
MRQMAWQRASVGRGTDAPAGELKPWEAGPMNDDCHADDEITRLREKLGKAEKAIYRLTRRVNELRSCCADLRELVKWEEGHENNTL